MRKRKHLENEAVLWDSLDREDEEGADLERVDHLRATATTRHHSRVPLQVLLHFLRFDEVLLQQQITTNAAFFCRKVLRCHLDHLGNCWESGDEICVERSERAVRMESVQVEVGQQCADVVPT